MDKALVYGTRDSGTLNEYVATRKLGTDESSVIQILAHRNATQRKSIREAYTRAYGEDLLKDLEKELSGDFLRAVFLWTLDPAERDAHLANEALRNFSPTNLVIVVEIACTGIASSSHPTQTSLSFSLQQIPRRRRRSSHRWTLLFRKLLVPLVSSFRYGGDEVNLAVSGKVRSEDTSHEKISHKAYADEELIRIIATRSKAQDQCNDQPAEEESMAMKIKREYYKRNSIGLEEAIRNDTSGDYQKFLLALL
ncbi:annexin p33 [Genlisea aurea]|uniref:Annexin p33 n=1 Tax=Genlisea aurea TaxID=192259 RepID=S8CC48_9LAMI|nr:annexin p33 [Genlisea aurea]